MMGVFVKSHFIGKALIKEIEEKQFPQLWMNKLRHIAQLSTEIEPEVTWSRYPVLTIIAFGFRLKNIHAKMPRMLKKNVKRSSKHHRNFIVGGLKKSKNEMILLSVFEKRRHFKNQDLVPTIIVLLRHFLHKK